MICMIFYLSEYVIWDIEEKRVRLLARNHCGCHRVNNISNSVHIASFFQHLSSCQISNKHTHNLCSLSNGLTEDK